MQTAGVFPEMGHFVVKERFGDDIEMHGMGSNLSLQGLDIDTPGELLAGERYVWLEFSPDDSEDRVTALGEITERHSLGVRVEFKHLFPDYRRKLAILLDEEAPN